MSDREEYETATPHGVEGEMEEALENTQPILELGEQLAESAVAGAARKAGRTPEEQWERMGDRFEYMAAEQNPHQKQLDDYELSGDTVRVEQ